MTRLLFALALLAACGPAGGRFLVLESEHVAGIDRVCIYADALGEVATTVRAWERCAPTLELDEAGQ